MTSQEGDWKIEELDNGDLVVWFRGKLPAAEPRPVIRLTIDGADLYDEAMPDPLEFMAPNTWHRVLHIPRIERRDFKAAIGGIP